MAKVFVFLALLLCAKPLLAEPKIYYAPAGNVGSLIICEQSGYARVYAMFTDGVARMHYDATGKTLDGLKFALLMRSFTTSSPAFWQEWFERKPYNPEKEDEVAFVQGEAVKFENDKAVIKGQLVINDIRKDISFEATLNKTGRISKTKDVFEDGAPTLGFSMHANFKRSDFSVGASAENSSFNDEAILMLDVVAQ